MSKFQNSPGKNNLNESEAATTELLFMQGILASNCRGINQNQITLEESEETYKILITLQNSSNYALQQPPASPSA
jgi:hypothetical protein